VSRAEEEARLVAGCLATLWYRRLLHLQAQTDSLSKHRLRARCGSALQIELRRTNEQLLDDCCILHGRTETRQAESRCPGRVTNRPRTQPGRLSACWRYLDGVHFPGRSRRKLQRQRRNNTHRVRIYGRRGAESRAWTPHPRDRPGRGAAIFTGSGCRADALLQQESGKQLCGARPVQSRTSRRSHKTRGVMLVLGPKSKPPRRIHLGPRLSCMAIPAHPAWPMHG
jgi:hypothetical protein